MKYSETFVSINGTIFTSFCSYFSACPPLKKFPQFPHIIIEPGPRAIGTIRNLQCEPGLQAVGTPAIKCQKDATWSPLDFACKCEYMCILSNNLHCIYNNYSTFYLQKGLSKQCRPRSDNVQCGIWSASNTCLPLIKQFGWHINMYYNGFVNMLGCLW